jgi:hypothetical protein
MAVPAEAALEKSRWLRTERPDVWWAGPLVTAVVLLSFVGYATWRVFTGGNFEHGELLSPFFSPNFEHWFHIPFGLTPAFLILPIPAGFRFTCYYYRKAYYRSIWQDPPGCGVGEPRKHYWGERVGPLILQNSHRFFLYAAILILFVLWYDVWKALWPGQKFGVTVGTLVLGLNTTLLTFYTLSCHSLRHLVGGKLDCFSCPAANMPRYRVWSKLTKMNEHHMLWAWTSLFAVMFADFYVMMVASGIWKNVRLL